MTIKRTRAADALGDLILDVFRLNGLLLTAGDRMVAHLGLTSTRWQVLGAIAFAERPSPLRGSPATWADWDSVLAHVTVLSAQTTPYHPCDLNVLALT